MTPDASPFASLRVAVERLDHLDGFGCSLIPEDPDYCLCGLDRVQDAASRYLDNTEDGE